MRFQESESIELKRQVNKDFAKEVVAFLNTRNGTIYIGVDDSGKVIGVPNVDRTMMEVRDIIRDQILPSTEGLCEIGSVLIEDKVVVKVIVTKGTKLYYVKKEGRSSSGCFFRDGTSSTPMSEEEIEKRFIDSLPKPKRPLLSEIPVVRTDLTFNLLKSLLISKGNHINEKTFLRNYNLVMPDGRFNLLADILSDDNIHPLAVCIFKGKDKVDYYKRNEYGNTSLIRGYQSVIDYCESLNDTYVDVGSRPRKEKRMFDNKAFEEAWINACVHNRWDSGISPQVFWFDDRMEIVSQGGIPDVMSKEDFLNGVTNPVNPDLMNIFIKCDICEESGHGVRDIVSSYGDQAFKFNEHRITVTIPFDKVGFNLKQVSNGTIKGKNDTISDENGTIKGKNDTISDEDGTIKAENDTIKGKNGTISNKNGTIKSKNGTINGAESAIDELTNGESGNSNKRASELSRPEKMILNVLSSNGHLTRKELSQKTKLSERTVSRTINSLKARGLIIRIGSNKYGHWEIFGSEKK